MLPTEILVHIFEYLRGKDIINLRKTCKLFADVVKLVRCPKTIVHYKTEEDVLYGFVNCVIYKPMSDISMWRKVKCDFPVEDLCAYNGLRKLITYKTARNKGVVTIPKITVGKAKFYNFSTNFVDVVDLTISFNNQITSISNMPNMKSIIIFEDDSLLRVYDMPVLEKLSISATNHIEIRNLPALKHLEYHCSMDIDFDTIPNIEFLEASGEYEMKFRHKFTNLTTLVISNSDYELDMDYIGSLKTLEKVDFTNSKVGDVSNLTHVKDICLFGSDVTDITMLTNLQKLDISYTSIKKLPPNNKITHLIAEAYTGKRLRNIRHVKHLDINRATNIKRLPRKNVIEVLNASLSTLKCIKSLKRVTELNINKTRVPYILKKNRIETIRMCNTPITNINDLVNAKYIDACENSISQLPKFTRIEYLDVSNSKVAEVHYCPTLTELRVNYTNVEKVDHITNVVNLHILRSKVKAVRNLTRLEFLYARNNVIVEGCPILKK